MSSPGQAQPSDCERKEWTKNDLCGQCCMIDLYNTHSADRLCIKTSPDTQCPLCHFFLATHSSTYNMSESHPERVTLRHINLYGSPKYKFWSANDWGEDSFFLPYSDSKNSTSGPIRVSSVSENSIDYLTVRNWLSSCQSQHVKTCSSSDTTSHRPNISLKVIDCLSRVVVDAKPDCEYLALSYVWGPTSNTLRSRHFDDHVPQTIKDAIHVTLQLGHQYLWVDQYCIDQEDTVTRHQQLSNMDSVYNNAVLTIIASAGVDCHHGLPGVSISRAKQPSIHLDGQLWLSTMRNPYEVITRAKWSERAWTYQEGVCSQRRLIFTAEQIMFECRAGAWWESLKHTSGSLRPLGNFLGNTFLVDDNNYKAIHALGHLLFHISRFTRRQLTYQSDALNAIRGVLRVYERKYQIHHHWGLPFITLSDFSRALSWFNSDDCAKGRRTDFPSWSWCGWTVGIHWIDTATSTGEPWRQLRIPPQYFIQDLVRTPSEQPVWRPLDTSNCSSQNALQSTVLRITAESVYIRIKIADAQESQITDKFRFSFKRSQFVAYLPNQPLGHDCQCHPVWPIHLTIDLEERLDGQQNLFDTSFQVLIIHPFQGLVLWDLNGVTERIGTVALDGTVIRCERHVSEYRTKNHFLDDMSPTEECITDLN